jgi:hypothetical protein
MLVSCRRGHQVGRRPNGGAPTSQEATSPSNARCTLGLTETSESKNGGHLAAVELHVLPCGERNATALPAIHP